MTDNEYLPGNEAADATFLMIEFEMFGKKQSAMVTGSDKD